MIGALLRMPGDAIRERMLSDLHAGGFDDLVPAHMSVLRWPGPQGQRPSDVARQVGATKQAMNYLLRQLEELGYLTLGGDERDQRSKRIALTDRGMAAARTVRASVRKIERELEDELGTARFEQLRGLLAALNKTAFVRDRQV